MIQMTDQDQYKELCALLGDIEVQLSELTATKTLLLRQLHQLKLKSNTHENQEYSI